MNCIKWKYFVENQAILRSSPPPCSSRLIGLISFLFDVGLVLLEYVLSFFSYFTQRHTRTHEKSFLNISQIDIHNNTHTFFFSDSNSNSYSILSSHASSSRFCIRIILYEVFVSCFIFFFFLWNEKKKFFFIPFPCLVTRKMKHMKHERGKSREK